jgi:transposase
MRKISSKIKLYGGVDLHNDSFNVYIVDHDDRKCDSRKVPTLDEEVRKYFEPFREYDLVVAVETGNLSFWFCDILEAMGIGYFIVNTLEYQRTSNSKKKNDKRDAMHLALDLKNKNLPKVAVFKPGIVQRQLRTLITQRYQYMKDRVRVINRTKSFLSSKGIKAKKKSLGTSFKYWESLFAQLKKGDPFVLEVLRCYHQDFKQIMLHIKEAEARLWQLIKAHYLSTYKRLITIPGIGFVIASALIALVGDWSRFKSGKKFVGYLGLAPATRETSTRKLKGHGLITREGSSLMRSYMLQGVLCITRKKSQNCIPLKRWYENIKIKKGWKKARVALARKLCEVIYSMLTNGTDYDPSFLTKNIKPAL